MLQVFISHLLYGCFSEVKADDTPAVQAVLNADVKRLELLEEVGGAGHYIHIHTSLTLTLCVYMYVCMYD